MNQYAQKIHQIIQKKPDERIAYLGDETTRELINALAEQEDGNILWLDADQRPLITLPEELKKELAEIDVLIYAITKQYGDERAFRDELNTYIEERGGRVGNLLDATQEVLASAFTGDIREIIDRTEHVYEKMQQQKQVLLSSPAGTHALIRFDTNKYSWLASTGVIQRAKTRNLLPAEVYTYPASVDGTIVIDGAYAPLASHPQKEELLEQLKGTPIYWIVREGVIQEIRCADPELLRIARKAIQVDENAARIGEFGMGTNTGIKTFLGHVMHDEKYPGVHIAHGHGYPKQTGAPYTSTQHADGILRKPSVQLLDGTYIIKKGAYQIS